MRSYWFGDEDDHGCTRAGGDPDTLARRVSSLRAGPGDIVPPDWRHARECGAVKDREEYLSKLREVCIRLAREQVASSLSGEDTELMEMVMLLDGMDRAVNQLGEHLSCWYRVRHPGEGWKYRPRDSRRVLARIGEDAGGPLKDALGGVLALREARALLAREIGERSARVLPNCSAIVGGLVAARIMALAGGLPDLARLPASSLQVLGARGALFSHLTGGTPSPKHGIIYQHLRVHNAPRGVRGKVARALAGRLAIAARIDRYRGTLDPEFIARSDRMIEAAGGRR
ncbi:MAG: RNA-processing protein [Methanomicrobiales archaeon]|nr:RNA-processing protein [Methanomicrobiales archaeon]